MGEIEYSFSVEVAKEYGVNEAILIKNFQYWILKNKANGKNFIDGRYWTYNSQKALEVLFPFWSQKTIRTALEHLEKQKVIIKGNHNNNSYDRTCWYAFEDEEKWLTHCFITFAEIGKSKCRNRQIEMPKSADQYQIINTDNKTNNKQDINISSQEDKKYAFEGKIIKLSQKDFEKWQKAYPDLNLYGECLLRDEWLAEQTPEEQKKWFMSTSQYFIKRNEFRKRQNAELDEKMEEPKSSIFDDEPKTEHDWSWV